MGPNIFAVEHIQNECGGPCGRAARGRHLRGAGGAAAAPQVPAPTCQTKDPSKAKCDFKLTDAEVTKFSALETKGLNNIKSSLNSLLSKYSGADGLFKVFPASKGSNWLTAVIVKLMVKACGLVEINKAQAKKSMQAILSSQQAGGNFKVVGTMIHNDIVGTKNTIQTDTVALTAYAVIAMTEYAMKTDDKCCLLEPIPSMDQKINKALAFLETKKHANKFTKAVLTYAKLFYREKRKGGNVAQLGKGQLGVVVGQVGGQLGGAGGYRSSTDQDIQDIISEAITDASTGNIHWSAGKGAVNDVQTIELTAYNTMSLALKNKIKMAEGAAKWMASKLNAAGGFKTSKDTMLALEAVSAYRRSSCNKLTMTTVNVTTGNQLFNFSFGDHSTDVLKERDLDISPNAESSIPVRITSNGTGCFLVQTILNYNIKRIPQNCVFALTVRQEKNKKIKICAKYNGTAEKTNMVLIEVEFQTGYAPTRNSIDALLNMKSSDRDYAQVKYHEFKESKNKLVLYFDEMTKTRSCYEIELTHMQAVKHLKPSIVSIYDYYNPIEKCIVRYQAPKDFTKPSKNTEQKIPLWNRLANKEIIGNGSASGVEAFNDYQNYYDDDKIEF